MQPHRWGVQPHRWVVQVALLLHHRHAEMGARVHGDAALPAMWCTNAEKAGNGVVGTPSDVRGWRRAFLPSSLTWSDTWSIMCDASFGYASGMVSEFGLTVDEGHGRAGYRKWGGGLWSSARRLCLRSILRSILRGILRGVLRGVLRDIPMAWRTKVLNPTP